MGATYPGHEIVKKPSISMVFLCLHTIFMVFLRPVVGKNHPNIITWPSFWSKLYMEPFSGTPDIISQSPIFRLPPAALQPDDDFA